MYVCCVLHIYENMYLSPLGEKAAESWALTCNHYNLFNVVLVLSIIIVESSMWSYNDCKLVSYSSTITRFALHIGSSWTLQE